MLYATTQTAPRSIATPLRKLISTTGGNNEVGNAHQPINASPARVKTTRSGPRRPNRSRTQRATSATPTIDRATPAAYASDSRCWTPNPTSSGPAIAGNAGTSNARQPGAAGTGSGRSRMAVTMLKRLDRQAVTVTAINVNTTPSP